MMYRVILLIGVAIAGPANAECVQWGRDMLGARVCMAGDLVNRNPILPELPITACPALTGCNGLATHTPPPKCDDGWTLVADLMMHPVCARELRQPK